jgi:hypothetical protein
MRRYKGMLSVQNRQVGFKTRRTVRRLAERSTLAPAGSSVPGAVGTVAGGGVAALTGRKDRPTLKMTRIDMAVRRTLVMVSVLDMSPLSRAMIAAAPYSTSRASHECYGASTDTKNWSGVAGLAEAGGLVNASNLR